MRPCERPELSGVRQLAGALGVPLLDPGHRLLAEDLLEPSIRVIGRVDAIGGDDAQQRRQRPGK